jgi:hypothetical protein
MVVAVAALVTEIQDQTPEVMAEVAVADTAPVDIVIVKVAVALITTAAITVPMD